MAHDIHMHFLLNGFEWTFSEEDIRVPSPEEIEDTLAVLETRLADENPGTTIFGGRLAVQKNENHTDVYVHFGEIT